MKSTEEDVQAHPVIANATNWMPLDTTTHQDHVIAHVLGATVLGYFVLDETLYMSLDIGFIWIIYIDGQMGLVPQGVALDEIEVEEDIRSKIKAEVGSLVGDSEGSYSHLVQAEPTCTITEVNFFGADNGRRRLIVSGEESSLIIETSLASAEIKVYGAS